MVMLACGCSRTERLRVSVSDAVLQSSYLGNGVEWDPYDEAPGWGVEVSDADWKKLTARMDFLRPGFIRCMTGTGMRSRCSASSPIARTGASKSCSGNSTRRTSP